MKYFLGKQGNLNLGKRSETSFKKTLFCIGNCFKKLCLRKLLKIYHRKTINFVTKLHRNNFLK